MRDKIVAAADAAALIHDGDCVTTSGFVGIGVPEALLEAVAERFDIEGAPRDLTLLFAAGQGDGQAQGLNRLGARGLLRRVIGGHWGLIPRIAQQALNGEIEGWNFPQGVISHLYREIAAGRPGCLTHVGLETFVDPRLDGGRINDRSTEDMVELIEIGGEQKLFYKSMPIHAALLRGTTADPSGNITMEREALYLDNLSQAMAAKNSGGVVIVQVERVAAARSLPARDVVIPGALVDAVVVAPSALHQQTYATAYSPYFAHELRARDDAAEAGALDARKIIARRAAFELPIDGVVNLGIGMPEGIAAVAAEEGLLEQVTLTAEPGVVGGQPASGLNFGAASNVSALIHQNQQFDFYDGGGLDMACLGMAEADAAGDVNVSRFGPKLAGAGGFINISQNARRVVFAGTFTAGGLSVAAHDGALMIEREGKARKFVSAVEQITYSGARAARLGQPALFVTERCVLELTPDGLRLSEIAPGVDIGRDILAKMDFAPLIDDPAPMDPRIFLPQRMNLARDLLHLDMEDRIRWDAGRALLFINLERMRIRAEADLTAIRARVEQICAGRTGRVDVVVNYDQTRLDEEIAPAYRALVAELERRFYGRVSRYAASAFQRRLIGRALGAAEIGESAEAALARLEG